MPLTLRLVLGSLLVLAGAALLVVAVLGARRRLPRNRWAGVRTGATLRTEQSFTVANQVASAPTAAAGLVGAVGGAVLLVGPGAAVGWIVLAVSVVGLVVIAGVGGVAGDRAARALTPSAPAPAACAGMCAGCDLVAGCRNTVAAGSGDDAGGSDRG